LYFQESLTICGIVEVSQCAFLPIKFPDPRIDCFKKGGGGLKSAESYIQPDERASMIFVMGIF